jgi:L-ascorbate metabolism protein UlaG (beta-lactamase superfamily)
MKILFVGHSTVKVEIAGSNLLIDPYFADKAGPFKRSKKLNITINDVFPIDAVLVSHTHPDHFDRMALGEIKKDIKFLIPEDQKDKATQLGFINVEGTAPWKQYKIDEVVVYGVPAVHMKNTVGFIIQGENRTLYFSGDTIFFDGFRKIATKFEKIDIAFLPVDGGKLFFKKTTMNPKEAIEAVKILKPTHVVPIHCGNKPRIPIVKKTGDPITFLELGKKSRLPSKITVMKEGEVLEI